ncbi:TAXI family TRAP transporter solute-binding subunit [Pseudooceanicola sediminis]|uniref:TAXI family TRAP transporter solute-binding subunit n=1 Tax=Pseudooceanicola sediminis TaxID=2211117 RepID=A0A399IYC8_9RHOB|nr:TAXI family TRAP transporter solute-binding subunit [Pseudooceanicola sediminis]KAA2312408.1 TAXI family TRAP transporter solute-binding subunit [Puniceibacterium sp. HSS470]RII37457.1 TAXI family TRAP transporter solute-binding subunit [Pseudooceanicola sediminis]
MSVLSKSLRTLSATALIAAAPLAALSQTEVIIGARESGSNDYVVGAAVAATVSEGADLTGKVLTASGAGVWMPMMDYGEVDLGVTSHYEAWLGWKGKGAFNTPHDIRAVVVGGGINVGLFVPNDSPIMSRDEMAGMKMASEFSGSPAVGDYALGEIANAGLTWDDVQPIPRASLYASLREDVSEGRLDVYYASVGSGITGELDSTIGIRFLGLDTSPEALAKMREVYPALVSEVPAGPPGIREPISLTYLATYIVASAAVSDDTVYAVTKAMYEKNDDFRAINKSLGGWKSENFATADVVVPYHDGAIRYFKEAGLWSDAMQARQDVLLAE